MMIHELISNLLGLGAIISLLIAVVFMLLGLRVRNARAHRVFVDIEGVWQSMLDDEFQKTIHTACVFIGPDGKIHIDHSEDRSYYHKIMGEER